MIGWLWLGLAVGAAAEETDVIREVATGVEVNWTDLTLTASGVGRTGGTEGRRAIEQLARREVEVSMRQGSARIPVTSSATLDDLSEDPALADALATRVSRWVVTEARYFASGRVELDAELSLQDLLKPYTLRAAKPVPDSFVDTTHTGVLVDARGWRTQLAWAPRLLDSDGNVLYGGALWEAQAVSASPAVYVADPAHPAAQRAGERPFVASIASTQGPDLVLSDADAARFRSLMAATRVLGEGTVVVVVDP